MKLKNSEEHTRIIWCSIIRPKSKVPKQRTPLLFPSHPIRHLLCATYLFLGLTFVSSCADGIHFLKASTYFTLIATDLKVHATSSGVPLYTPRVLSCFCKYLHVAWTVWKSMIKGLLTSFWQNVLRGIHSLDDLVQSQLPTVHINSIMSLCNNSYFLFSFFPILPFPLYEHLPNKLPAHRHLYPSNYNGNAKISLLQPLHFVLPRACINFIFKFLWISCC